MAKAPIALPLPIDDPEPQECPKCPPVGAPAWMATFADIATLLMAFFVLILSFAEFNQPKFKMVAGSLKNAFGVQRQVPVVEQPKGTTVLKLEFSPSPQASMIKEITQQTTDTEKPQLETPDSPEPKEARNDGPGQAGTPTAAAELAQALSQALGQGQLSAQVEGDQVVLRFDASAEDSAALAQQLAQASDAMQKAMQKAQQNGGAADAEVVLAGLAQALPDLATATAAAANQGQGQSDTAGTAGRQAALAEAKLQVALRREVSQGLVTIEQRDDKVFLTVGAGGAFPSGAADLTNEARDIMARLAFSAMDQASRIEVTGHTDDVPLSAGSAYRDNWGLAAARASSVVRELSGYGLIDPTRLTAISKGESAPVADNTTAAGREENRRIEIEISY